MGLFNLRRKFFFIWEISCIIYVFVGIFLNRKLKKGMGEKRIYYIVFICGEG